MMQPQTWFPTVGGSINACRRRWGKRLSAPNYTWIGLVTWQWKIDCFRVWGFEDFEFWRISSRKLAPELWSLAGKCSAGSLFFFLILETAGKIRSPQDMRGQIGQMKGWWAPTMTYTPVQSEVELDLAVRMFSACTDKSSSWTYCDEPLLLIESLSTEASHTSDWALYMMMINVQHSTISL